MFAVADGDASAAPARSFLMPLIYDEREFVAAEAIDGLASGETRLDVEAIERMSQHPSPYVRGALLRYLAHIRGHSAIPVLVGGLKDASHIIRQNAIDELAELGARAAVPAIRPLLDDGNPDVREAAHYALQTLSGS